MQHDLDAQAFAALRTGRSLLRATALFDSAAEASQTQVADKPALAAVLSIHEYERQRFAQELHDSAGQLIVALQLSVAQLKRVEGPSDHSDLIEEIQDAVSRIGQEIRSIAFLSYPTDLCDRSLFLALESLIEGFGRRTGIHTSYRWVGDRSSIDVAVSTAILRVAQEALVNVHRHSQASSVAIAVEHKTDRLHVTIADNGLGLKTTEGLEGIGLKGMRYRIAALGGEFEIRNLKRGARISASIPLPMVGSAGS